MLELKEFKQVIEREKAVNDYLDKLAELNINIWENSDLGWYRDSYIDLVEAAMEDTDHFTTAFCYEYNYGAEPFTVFIDGETEIQVNDIEDLYRAIQMAYEKRLIAEEYDFK